MKLDDAEKIVGEAIQKKLVVEVEYIRKEDGVKTCRMMEPFDIKAGSRSKTGKLMFWGWCLYHHHIEQKLISNIISVRITDDSFNPKNREITFTAKPIYRILRDW